MADSIFELPESIFEVAESIFEPPVLILGQPIPIMGQSDWGLRWRKGFEEWRQVAQIFKSAVSPVSNRQGPRKK